MQIASAFDALIQRAVVQIIYDGKTEKAVRYIASETFGEVLEKLIILHVRIWMLEDEAGKVKGTPEATAIHEKLDICDKVTRPRLMAALGQILEEIILENRLDLVRSPDVKRYEGFE